MFARFKKKEKKENTFDIYLEEKLYRIVIKWAKRFSVFTLLMTPLILFFFEGDFEIIQVFAFIGILLMSFQWAWEFIYSIFRYRLKNVLAFQVISSYRKEYASLYLDLLFLTGIIFVLFCVGIVGILEFYSLNQYSFFDLIQYPFFRFVGLYLAVIVCLRIYIYTMKNTLGKVMLNELVKKRVQGDVQKINIPDAIFQQTADLVDKLYESVADTMQEKVNAEKMKTELITNVTHDIKTPLTSIINYINLLQMETNVDEKERYLHVLEYNSKRLKSLILDLIYASKTGSGSIDLNMELIELNELILQVYGQFDRSFQEKKLEFVFNSKRNNIYMLTDGAQLSRVIENLLSNCVKYSMENTRVYGTAEYEYGKIKVEFKNLSKVKLNMSEKVLISQFTRGDKSRHEEGSGLGLYITNNLVELLGGEFEVKINGDLFISTIEFSVRVKEQE